MLLKDESDDLAKVADELGVDWVVEGSVRRTGRQVRITARLVDPASLETLWASSYDRDLADIFAIQSDVARSVAQALQVKLTNAERDRMNRLPTRSITAHDLYLKGRSEWNRRTEESLRTAIDLFERALAEDSMYAEAWAGLASAWTVLPYYSDTSLKYSLPRSVNAAQRALGLDSLLSEAYVVLAYTQTGTVHPDETIRGFQTALRLNPGYATGRQWYAFILFRLGRFEEARGQMIVARDLDPLSRIIAVEVGLVDFYGREFNRAITVYREAIEEDSTFAQVYVFLAEALEATGDYGKAIEAIRIYSLLRDQPEDVVDRMTLRLVEALRTGGRAGYWAERLRLLEVQGIGQSHVRAAAVFAAAGDNDRGFEQLYQALEREDPFWLEIAVDPGLTPLRSDPRWAELMDRFYEEWPGYEEATARNSQ